MPATMSLSIITVTSIYLRYKIIKCNRLFHCVTRNASQQRKAFLAGRLAEILQKQLRPTLSILIVGGIDAIFNLLFVILYMALVFANVTPLTQLYMIQFLLTPIQICQSLSHSMSYGVYNKEIRDKLLDYVKVCTTRHSKVIALNGK